MRVLNGSCSSFYFSLVKCIEFISCYSIYLNWWIVTRNAVGGQVLIRRRSECHFIFPIKIFFFCLFFLLLGFNSINISAVARLSIVNCFVGCCLSTGRCSEVWDLRVTIRNVGNCLGRRVSFVICHRAPWISKTKRKENRDGDLYHRYSSKIPSLIFQFNFYWFQSTLIDGS